MRHALIALCLMLGSGGVNALSINIDFDDHHAGPGTTYGGEANTPGYWNVVTDNYASTSLLDTSGAATGASVSLFSALELRSGHVAFGGDTDYQRVVNDNFYIQSDSQGVGYQASVTGLANGFYEVFFYAPENPGVVTGNLTVNGRYLGGIAHGVSSLLVNVTDSSLNISSAGKTRYEGLAGLQITAAVPIPAAAWLFGSALAGLGWLRRKPGA